MIKKIFAQVPLNHIGGPGEEGFGPWGHLWQYTEVGEAARAFTGVISRIIGLLTIIAGIWFVFQFIIGAYGFLTAAGDPKAIESATKRITHAIIGLVVVVAAYALISLIGALLGFEILQPQQFIEQLRPGG